MGQGQQTPSQTQEQDLQRFQDAGQAYDIIAPFVEQQFDFRQSGITYVCNELGNVDQPSLGAQLMKSGLKLGLAAAAGAVGAFTSGLGWVALGAIGLGFGMGGEIVDAVFTGPSAPAGVEAFRLGRDNVLNRMKAVESSTLRQRLNQATPEQRLAAYNDYERLQTSNELQQAEINSTLDGWMNAVNQQANGTGGSIGQGAEASTDMTTGRLFLSGRAYRREGSVMVGLSSASIDGLDNQELRNSYLNRSLGEVGMFVDFALYAGGEWGALTFQAGNTNIGIQGGDRFKSAIARFGEAHDRPGFWSADHNFAQDWAEGAQRLLSILRGNTLRSFGLSSIETGGMFD
jgi:hypothetical protein